MNVVFANSPSKEPTDESCVREQDVCKCICSYLINVFHRDHNIYVTEPIVHDRIFIESGHINSNYNGAIKPVTYKRRAFVTLPRFKSGVPVTLATITNQRRGDTTLLAPFPNWEAQREGNCDGVTSVYRIRVNI